MTPLNIAVKLAAIVLLLALLGYVVD